MSSRFLTPAGLRLLFAAFGLVTMAVLRRRLLVEGEISAWAEISAWLLFLAGFAWARDLAPRFESMVTRLFHRGVVSLPGEVAGPLIASIEGRARIAARVGRIAVPLILLAAYRWVYLVREAPGDHFEIKLALEVVAAALAGSLGGRLVAYGFLGSFLKRRNAEVTVRPGHPDGAGGLEIVGRYFLYQAGLVMLPVLFFAFWWAVGPSWPVTHEDGLDFDQWRNPFALFFFLLLGLEILAFLAPMAGFHREMLRQRVRAGLETDEIGDAIIRLEEAMAGAADPAELEALQFRRQVLQSRFDLLESTPVWPIDRRIRRLFAWGNVSVFAVPLIANLPFMPATIRETLANLLGFD